MLDNHYTYDEGPNKAPTTFVFGPRYLASHVYQLSPHEVSIAILNAPIIVDQK